MGKEGETREEIYDFIVHYKLKHNGLSPSVREIAKFVGRGSIGNVSYHLKVLQIEGRIVQHEKRGYMIPGSMWLPAESVNALIRLKNDPPLDASVIEPVIEGALGIPEK